MNHTVKYLALFSLAFSLAACDDDGLDVRDMEIPQGYALSAGISTIFLNSSVAYDTQADWIDTDPDYAMRFRDGDGLYDDTRTISGGLGPVYAGYSCGSCHRNAGRTKPELWNGGGSFGEGGSGSYGFSSNVGVHQPQERRIFPELRTRYFMTKPFTVLNRKAS